MSVERTEIEWTYTPPGFFEATYTCAESDYVLNVGDGIAMATLTVPQDPIPEDLLSRMAERVRGLMKVRQLQVHRAFALSESRVRQFEDGHMRVAISISCSACGAVAGGVDLVQRDSDGNVVKDTKAERIAEHQAMLDSVAPKVEESPELDSMLDSYGQSVVEPGNELVHLYEVRDALAKHYGGQSEAQAALGIPSAEWSRVGRLANVEPVEQGRHRGKHPTTRRQATEQELDEVRTIVRSWIVAFANQLPAPS